MLAVGFMAGPPAEAASALTHEQALKRALDQLDDMFRDREWLPGGRCTGKGDWETSDGSVTLKENMSSGGRVAHADQPDDHNGTQDKPSRDGPTRGGEAQDETGGKILGGNSDKGCSREPGLVEPCAAARAHGGMKKDSENGVAHCRESQYEAADERGVSWKAYEGKAVELPSKAYIGGLVHDWVRDEPFVRGGYCYPKVGFDENTHADAAASVGGRLFFAGEHTNMPTGMTVHAAIDSGER